MGNFVDCYETSAMCNKTQRLGTTLIKAGVILMELSLKSGNFQAIFYVSMRAFDDVTFTLL